MYRRYDSLLGASHMSFVAGAQAPDGTPVSFLLKAHAYSYVPAEYYIQVGGQKDGWAEGWVRRVGGMPAAPLRGGRHPNPCLLIRLLPEPAA